jgi:hypothetical protein
MSMGKVLPTVYSSLRPKSGGLAGLLAQAPAVSAAFGKWLGFILMMTALLVFFSLGVVTIVIASKEIAHLIG